MWYVMSVLSIYLHGGLCAFIGSPKLTNNNNNEIFPEFMIIILGFAESVMGEGLLKTKIVTFQSNILRAAISTPETEGAGSGRSCKRKEPSEQRQKGHKHLEELALDLNNIIIVHLHTFIKRA